MDTVQDRGSYVEHEGRPAVRFVRTYSHPPERVWATLTEPDELGHWFPSAVRFDLRVGGRVTFADDPHAVPTEGTVLACDPPRRLAFSWGGDELHFTLTEPEPGSTVLEMVDVLEARDTAARNAAGWEVCLAELDKHLAGRDAAGPHSDGARPWRPVYDAYVAAGLPSGAWIPENPDGR